MSDVVRIDSREAFFNQKPTLLQVALPDMGATIYLLKGTPAINRQIETMRESSEGNARDITQQLALILCDSDGNVICQNPEDIEKLSKLITLTDISMALEKWLHLNGVSKEAMEAAAKNSAAGQSGDSASASPAT